MRLHMADLAAALKIRKSIAPKSDYRFVAFSTPQLHVDLKSANRTWLPDYQYYYISYDDLKFELKSRLYPAGAPTPKKWTEEDEKAFVQSLEGELDKVFTFQKVKAGEIIRRIKISEKEVEDVVKQLDSRPPARGANATWGQGGSSDQNGDGGPTEEDFALLEADLSDM